MPSAGRTSVLRRSRSTPRRRVAAGRARTGAARRAGRSRAPRRPLSPASNPRLPQPRAPHARRRRSLPGAAWSRCPAHAGRLSFLAATCAGTGVRGEFTDWSRSLSRARFRPSILTSAPSGR